MSIARANLDFPPLSSIDAAADAVDAFISGASWYIGAVVVLAGVLGVLGVDGGR